MKRRHDMKTRLELTIVACVCLAALALQAAPKPGDPKQFDSAQQAADALIAAAQTYDVPALTEILGEESRDLLVTQDPVQDKKIGVEFGEKAKAKTALVPDPENSKLITLTVGTDDWPLPIPIIKKGKTWSFDTKAGR